jgi:hypothetical protein
MQEASSGFIPSLDAGSEKEMTAKEATIRANKANVMVSGMLQSLDLQQNFYYEEIVRRFTDPKTGDREVKEFQAKCVEDGIPEEYIKDYRCWKIKTNRVLGGGDKSLAQAQAGWLFQNRTAYSPQSQQKIMSIVTRTMLDDPAKAADLVPDMPEMSTAGSRAAEDLFGTLMTGNKVSLRNGIDQQGYIETMLKFMENVVTMIEHTDNTGDVDQLLGLETVGQDVAQHIRILASDPAQGQLVKKYGDALSQLGNAIKGFGQRLNQKLNKQQTSEKVLIDYKDAPPDVKRQMESAAGFQPSQVPDGDPKTAKAVLTLATKEASFQQRQRHDQISFYLDEIRKSLENIGTIGHENALKRQELAHAALDKVMDLFNQASAPQPAPRTNGEAMPQSP